MDGSPQGGAVYSVSKLPDAAKSSGVDLKKWQTCYDARETSSIFASETAEANSFNLGGTPGTILINKKTGAYDTVEGAYPIDTFYQKIDALMK